jgi:outer membrane biosynthesis protein TonB
MSTAGRFVLENEKGEVVRTFSIEAEELFLIFNQDTRRVELHNSLETLDHEEIPYTLLKKTSVGGIKRRAVSLANGSSLRFAKEIDKTVALVQINDESEEQEKAIYKNTAYTQLGLMVFVLIMGLLIEPLFTHKPEDPVVTVIPQEFIQRKEQITVKAAEHKIDPVKKVANKKVVSRVKHISKVLTAPVKTARKENAPLRTKIKVENVGALGALGGMKSGSKNSAGFNMNALNDSRGTSWNGAGSGGVGGMERAIHGGGLVASASGQGSHIEGGGGYGTRGKAGGGRPGYGEMNMGGTSAAYFEPLQEEATVEGGLDKDAIAAVINRHIGEVIYCYEKGLQVQPGLSGRVGMKFVINGGGQVASAGVASSSLGSAQVESCITNHLKTWKFPHPIGGVNVKVQYPFVLKRMNHG